MKLGTFLKTFSVMRWGHRFKDRQALERYQVKALAAYREFLQQESPYFKSGIPADFKMNKAFMMEQFNELNTQGLDRDELLALAL